MSPKRSTVLLVLLLGAALAAPLEAQNRGADRTPPPKVGPRAHQESAPARGGAKGASGARQDAPDRAQRAASQDREAPTDGERSRPPRGDGAADPGADGSERTALDPRVFNARAEQAKAALQKVLSDPAKSAEEKRAARAAFDARMTNLRAALGKDEAGADPAAGAAEAGGAGDAQRAATVERARRVQEAGRAATNGRAAAGEAGEAAPERQALDPRVFNARAEQAQAALQKVLSDPAKSAEEKRAAQTAFDARMTNLRAALGKDEAGADPAAGAAEAGGAGDAQRAATVERARRVQEAGRAATNGRAAADAGEAAPERQALDPRVFNARAEQAQAALQKVLSDPAKSAEEKRAAQTAFDARMANLRAALGKDEAGADPAVGAEGADGTGDAQRAATVERARRVQEAGRAATNGRAAAAEAGEAAPERQALDPRVFNARAEQAQAALQKVLSDPSKSADEKRAAQTAFDARMANLRAALGKDEAGADPAAGAAEAGGAGDAQRAATVERARRAQEAGRAATNGRAAAGEAGEAAPERQALDPRVFNARAEQAQAALQKVLSDPSKSAEEKRAAQTAFDARMANLRAALGKDEAGADPAAGAEGADGTGDAQRAATVERARRAQEAGRGEADAPAERERSAADRRGAGTSDGRPDAAPPRRERTDGAPKKKAGERPRRGETPPKKPAVRERQKPLEPELARQVEEAQAALEKRLRAAGAEDDAIDTQKAVLRRRMIEAHQTAKAAQRAARERQAEAESRPPSAFVRKP